jgi:two-component system LytT family sensor kinase
MQLRPHFLLNALNSVAALLGHDAAAARQMLARIRDFLRLSLESSGSPTVALRDELSFLHHYLEIQRVRFQDRLVTAFDIDEGASAALVPSLILQPIVENAIRHGIAPRASGGHITIRAMRRRGRLELVVEDDGVGAGAPFDEKRFGLGLTNTKARLHLLYGKDQHFTVRSGAKWRFAVVLDIPFRRAPGATPEHPRPVNPIPTPGRIVSFS